MARALEMGQVASSNPKLVRTADCIIVQRTRQTDFHPKSMGRKIHVLVSSETQDLSRKPMNQVSRRNFSVFHVANVPAFHEMHKWITTQLRVLVDVWQKLYKKWAYYDFYYKQIHTTK